MDTDTQQSIVFVGLDPGASGAGSAIDQQCRMLHLFGFAKLSESEITDALDKMYEQLASDYSYTRTALELVGARPTDHRGALAKFMTTYGFLRGYLHARKIPFRDVKPGEWQRPLGLIAPAKTKQHVKKRKHRALAQQYWPETKITQDLCDAPLIAEWYRRQP